MNEPETRESPLFQLHQGPGWELHGLRSCQLGLHHLHPLRAGLTGYDRCHDGVGSYGYDRVNIGVRPSITMHRDMPRRLVKHLI